MYRFIAFNEKRFRQLVQLYTLYTQKWRKKKKTVLFYVPRIWCIGCTGCIAGQITGAGVSSDGKARRCLSVNARVYSRLVEEGKKFLGRAIERNQPDPLILEPLSTFYISPGPYFPFPDQLRHPSSRKSYPELDLRY